MNLNFERYKLLRLTTLYGQEFVFTLRGTNEFKEPTDKTQNFPIVGIYHETQGYVTQSGVEGGVIKTKPSSQILCLHEAAQTLSVGMEVTIQGGIYKLVDVRDVNNLGVACDLSLEKVLV